jgi:hypothetical protein
MHRLCAFVLSFGLLATMTFATKAQRGDDKTNPISIEVLLPYIGDENFQKELKLTDEQTKSLLAFRKKVWDEEYSTAEKDLNFFRIKRATEDAFESVLTEEQVQRAYQLSVQVVWKRHLSITSTPQVVSCFSLHYHSALDLLLKLDRTQRKIVDGRDRMRTPVYLTPEQSAVAKELLGPPPKATFYPQYDERSFGSRRFDPFGWNLLPALKFTSCEDVQKEIKLATEQKQALEELRQKVYKTEETRFSSDLSPEARNKAADEALAEILKATEKVLTAEQRQRLDQIRWQQTPNDSDEFTVGSELGKALGVTEAQRMKYNELFAKHTESCAKLLLSGEPQQRVKAAIDAANVDWEQSKNAILTVEQQAKKKELRGPEFTGRVVLRGVEISSSRQRELFFGRYTNQFATLLRYQGLQDELKLTRDQLTKLRGYVSELNARFLPERPFYFPKTPQTEAEYCSDRSAFIQKGLIDILTKEQQTRYRQLMLQRAESGLMPPNRIVIPSAAAYPGVAEAIKLTAEQKKMLLVGEGAAQVLSDEQKMAIKTMLGEPAKIAVIFSHPLLPGPIPKPTSWEQLLRDASIWDAIKLTPDQTRKLAHAANEYMLVLTQSSYLGGESPFQTGNKTIVAAQEAFTKAAESILTADQRKRLDQLALQQRAANSLHATLTLSTLSLAAVDKEVGLTPEQIKKIDTLASEFYTLAKSLKLYTLDVVREYWVKENDIRLKLRNQLDEGILEQLTAEQRARWKELTGEPHPDFDKRPLYGPATDYLGDPY